MLNTEQHFKCLAHFPNAVLHGITKVLNHQKIREVIISENISNWKSISLMSEFSIQSLLKFHPKRKKKGGTISSYIRWTYRKRKGDAKL